MYERRISREDQRVDVQATLWSILGHFTRRRFLKTIGAGAFGLAISVFPELKRVRANHVQTCISHGQYCSYSWCCSVGGVESCTAVAVCGGGTAWFQFHTRCDSIFGCDTTAGTCYSGITGPWYYCNPGCCCPTLGQVDNPCYYCDSRKPAPC